MRGLTWFAPVKGPGPIGEWPMLDERAPIVVVNLSHRPEMSTVDFARLLQLRRELLAQRRDLRVTGLRGRTKSIYEISRLQEALPVEPSQNVRGTESWT